MRVLSVPVLVGLSLIYGVLVFFRNRLFDWGIFLPEDCGAVVVSVGNLSAGGTGKTPILAFLADHVKKSARLGIVSRGYGRSTRGSQRVDLMKKDAAVLYGDEPTWLAGEIAVPVQVASRRSQAALDLVAAEGVRLVLMDDGFQHRWLSRDIDVVLVDAKCPKWQKRLLPWGRLREPMDSLQRAGWVFLTKIDGVAETEVAKIESDIKTFTKAPIIRWSHRARFAGLPVEGGGFVFAGVAKADDFFHQVREHLGEQRVLGTSAYKDHYRYTADDVRDILREVERLGAAFALTTEKDFVKLKGLWPRESMVPLLSVGVDVRPQRADDENELARLYAAIDKMVRRKNA